MSEDTVAQKPKIGLAILVTILGVACAAALFAMPVLGEEEAIVESSKWTVFLGALHPLVLHLPIGMLALVLLMEFGNLFRKGEGRSTLVPAFFTAVSAVVAVVFGFLLFQSEMSMYSGELINEHLWWGTGFASFMVLAFVVKYWVDLFKGAGNWIYFLSLLGSGAVMTVASHSGGTYVHGDPLDKAPWKEETEEPEGDSEVIPEEEKVVFTHVVLPIFEQKCVSCHGEKNKKGKLRMDSYDALLVGGKEGEAIEPGNAEDSNIMYRIHLPLDDDEHMPPADKKDKQMEEHEIAIVEWWIDSGASPDLKVVDADVPEEIKAAMDKLITPEERAAMAKAKKEAEEAEKAKRAELSKVVDTLRETFPAALNFESQVSSGLTFTAVSMRNKFGDEDLAKLKPITSDLVSMDLSGTQVTDQGIEVLGDATGLRMLRLSETAITDAAITDTIAKLVNLESLNLYGTTVTTEGVKELIDLPNLKTLYLWRTGVDEAGAAELREKMPDCDIILGVDVN